MHVLIIGTTGSGKTSLATLLASKYATKACVIVYDPFLDKRWPAGENVEVLSDWEKFQAVVRANNGSVVFIDESAETVSHAQRKSWWLATQSRHFGCVVHFIAQRYQQLPPTVRDQCSEIFVFRLSRRDAELASEEFCTDELLEAERFQRFEFARANRFGSCGFFRIVYGRVEDNSDASRFATIRSNRVAHLQ